MSFLVNIYWKIKARKYNKNEFRYRFISVVLVKNLNVRYI